MKSIFTFLLTLVVGASLLGCSQNDNHLTGAGSSFIDPALSVWTHDYANQTQTQINYQAIGSGGGLQQVYSGTIDFAASDMPLTVEELNEHHLQQFPMIVGGIVIAINVAGVQNNQLTLSGDVLENIYMGRIEYWDDQAIKRLNMGVTLPHEKIITIHRADGSGTTYNFTSYLSKISSEWEQHISTNTTVAWPGDGIGAKGNAGVAAQIMQTPNSIGYVEYAYAKQNNMVITKMINHDNKIVVANSASFEAAANNAKWVAADGFYQILTNQPGANTWPIVATTFILLPQTARTPQVKAQINAFFKWCFEKGGASAATLDYVAIPTTVYQEILKTFKD